MTKKQKIEIEENGLAQGSYDNITIMPQTTKRERIFNEIVETLKANKFFVLRPKYSRNSVYVLCRNLKEKAQVDACFGITETEKDGKKTRQFVLFLKKEKKD